MIQAQYQRALELAAKQLSYRALSARALQDKLMQKGISEDAAAYAIAWLEERALLDDSKLAESVVRAYQHKGYGKMRIAQEMHKRGIAQEDAQQALTAFAPDLDKMCALLEKRLRGDVSDRKEVDKAIASLQRRGYRWEEIRQALEAYQQSL